MPVLFTPSFLCVWNRMHRKNLRIIMQPRVICLHTVKYQTVLFDPLIGPYQVLPLQARVDLGAIAIKVYFIFLKASKIEASPLDGFVLYPGHSLLGEVLRLYRETVDVFYSPSRLDCCCFFRGEWVIVLVFLDGEGG